MEFGQQKLGRQGGLLARVCTGFVVSTRLPHLGAFRNRDARELAGFARVPQTWWHRDWLRPVVFSACPVVATCLSVVAPSPMSLLVPSLLVQRAPFCVPSFLPWRTLGVACVPGGSSMGVHSSGLCLLSQLSLLSCFIYWGGGRWGEPPTIGPPMRCPRAPPGCVLVLSPACPQEKLGFFVLPSCCSRPGSD